MRKVNFLDLKACFEPLRGEIMKGLDGVFERCDFVLGGPVKELEEKVREYCGVKHTLGVANGTDALIIAMRASGIGPGDIVITTPFTFIATAESVWAAGGTPVFCDIDPATYNLDPVAVRRYISEECDFADGKLIEKKSGGHVKAILPVHLYGLMADMNAFLEMGRKYGLKVIEDAAQSFGARMKIDGKDVICGNAGDAGCYSFYPSKTLGGAGDGGMIVTNDSHIHEVADTLHVHGGRVRYHHDMFGYNSRLDTMQAVPLMVKLPLVDKWIEMRRVNGALYNRLFEEKCAAAGVSFVYSADIPAGGARPDGAIVLPSEPDGFTHTYNTYEVRLPNRDVAAKYLQENGIGNCIYYPVPMHRQKVFQYLNVPDESLPVTNLVCEDILALPQYPELPHADIEYVVETLVGFLGK